MNNTDDQFVHQSVLLQESVAALAIKPEGVYVDGTFGRGGHSRAILAQLGAGGRLYAIDRDPQAIAEGERLAAQDSRFQIAYAPFSDLRRCCEQWGIVGKVNGLLLDIGVSSPQLDDASRGFSFRNDGPLDMRMNPNEGQSAAQWLAQAKEEDIANVLWQYGEERFSRRIAKAIVLARQEQSITRTKQLQEIVAKAHPRWEKGKDPATRAFQAIRIFINRELDELEKALAESLDVLVEGGRLVVISFHSLEDRMVKQFIQRESKGEEFPLDLPIQGRAAEGRLQRIGKMIKPGQTELQENPRARSSCLRVAEKRF
ncbi:MAG: 16S rRNA (cytosine(1402)-N(4))-methyltransferase RsmH [Gammaproteobacteria bacterium]|nr:16S rRNA (cytosine(1402)-N(4))-methyltransferase RsmH [Gammaproteobacteria bacterium]